MEDDLLVMCVTTDLDHARYQNIPFVLIACRGSVLLVAV